MSPEVAKKMIKEGTRVHVVIKEMELSQTIWAICHDRDTADYIAFREQMEEDGEFTVETWFVL